MSDSVDKGIGGKGVCGERKDDSLDDFNPNRPHLKDSNEVKQNLVVSLKGSFRKLSWSLPHQKKRKIKLYGNLNISSTFLSCNSKVYMKWVKGDYNCRMCWLHVNSFMS